MAAKFKCRAKMMQPVFTLSASFNALSDWAFDLSLCLCQLGIITCNALRVFHKPIKLCLRLLKPAVQYVELCSFRRLEIPGLEVVE